MTTCTIKSCVSDFLSQASSPLLVIRIVLSKHPKGQMLVMFWHLRWQTELLSLENCKEKWERKQSAKKNCDAGKAHAAKMSKGPKSFTPNGSTADNPPRLPLSLQYIGKSRINNSNLALLWHPGVPTFHPHRTF